MKARPFLAVLLALVLVVFALGLAGWWLVWQRSALRLQRQPLEIPRAARFVPREAPLSLYLFSDGDQPVAYARAVAPPRQRRQAAEAVARLRDGAFAAAGLDYDAELRSWLAAPVGLALLEPPPPPAGPTASGSGTASPRGGWLLVLGSRDDAGARRFLQRFWQTRSLAGTDLQISTYRGMGLISGQGALVGPSPMPLATALVDDDLVLIASGRGVLEQALDVSQIGELNQAGQPAFQEGLGRLGSGAALLQVAPEALERWLGVPLPAEEDQRPGHLLMALRPEGRALHLKGLLGLPPQTVLPEVGLDAVLGRALLGELHGPAASLALVQDPMAVATIPLLQPLLSRMAGGEGAAGPLPALVVASDTGPLLAAASGGHWLLGTAADRPEAAVVETSLAAEGLIARPPGGRRPCAAGLDPPAGRPRPTRRQDGAAAGPPGGLALAAGRSGLVGGVPRPAAEAGGSCQEGRPSSPGAAGGPRCWGCGPSVGPGWSPGSRPVDRLAALAAAHRPGRRLPLRAGRGAGPGPGGRARRAGARRPTWLRRSLSMAPAARELLLLRHGIAEERSPGRPDADRELTATGRIRTRAVLDLAARLGLKADRLLSSPLTRAWQTGEIALAAGLAADP